MSVLGLGILLIVAGLVIAFLSPSAGRAATVFWWVGIVLAVVGLILCLAPVVVYVDAQLRTMLGR